MMQPDLCRFPDCRRSVAAPGMSRCEAHRMRWLPNAPVEQVPMSPFVRRALAGTLPPKATA